MYKKITATLLSIIMLMSSFGVVSFSDASVVTILTERLSTETSATSTFVKPPKGMMTKMTYKAQLNGTNADASLFNWSVNPENQGVYVDNTGTVYVSGDTSLQSFNLTASLKSDPLSLATNTITLEDTVLYDFETADTTISDVTPSEETDGNQYMQGGTTGDSYKRINPKPFNSGKGYATISYDVKIGESCTTKYVWADTRYWTMYIYLNTSKRTPEIPAGFGNSAAVAIGSAMPVDEWVNIKLELNFDTGKYNVIVGNSVTNNLSHKDGSGFKLENMGFNYKVDNLRLYSGQAVERTVDIKNPSALSIPESGEISAKLYADVQAGDFKINEPLVWELAGEYSGVSISGDTIAVSSGAPSVVRVKASLKSAPEVYDEFDVSLTDEMNLDFSNGGTISGITGSVDVEVDSSGNTYLKTDGTASVVVDSLLQSGTVLAIGAGIHSTSQNISTLSISDDIEFIINKSEGVIYNSSDSQNKLKIGDTFNFDFVYDDINKKYMAFADNKLISTGSSESITPENFEFNTNLSSLYIGSARSKSPYVIKSEILGNAISGKTVEADVDTISENGAPVISSVISWYVDDSFVSTGTDFLIPDGSEGKEIYYTVSATNDYGTTSSVMSMKQTVKRLFEAVYSSDAVSISINNIWDSSKELVIYVVLYNNNRCVDILARPINVVLDSASAVIDITATSSFNKIDVFLVDADTLAPTGMPETIFGIPSGSVSGRVAAVYMLKPASEADILAKFEGAHNLSQLKTSINSDGDSVISVLAYACVAKLNADGSVNYDYTPERSGLYSVAVVTEDGTVSLTDKYTGTSDILNVNGVSNLSDIRVKPILKSLTGRDDSVINSSAEVYSSVSDKNMVISLADGRLDDVFASIYLSKAAQDSSADSNTIMELKKELSLLGKDTVAVDLLSKNIKYAQASQRANSSSYTDIDTYLGALKAASILCGVKNVVNHKDAKVFLEHISNSKYNHANDDEKNIIAQAIYGKSYASIAELSDAVNNVDISVNTGAGQSGGTPTNNNPTVSAGSFTGGTSALVPVQPPQTQSSLFADVAPGHWACEAIDYLAKNGIVNGYDGNFNPENTITRAEFLKLLCVSFNITLGDGTVFDDVSVDSWYAPYITGAAGAGLIMGDGKNFNPDNSIIRQDAATMVYRFAISAGYQISGAGTPFNDDLSISDYAKDAVYAMNAQGIINGTGNNLFEPASSATRAQAAQIIYKMLKTGGGK